MKTKLENTGLFTKEQIKELLPEIEKLEENDYSVYNRGVKFWARGDKARLYFTSANRNRGGFVDLINKTAHAQNKKPMEYDFMRKITDGTIFEVVEK